MFKNQKHLVIHAPNVHLGGGLILLKDLLSEPTAKWVQIDERIKHLLNLPVLVKGLYVKPTVFSRLLAEYRLWRSARSCDVVLCFNGLPPLFPISGCAVVFIQNRILIERTGLRDYPLKTRVRLNMEKLWLRLAKGNVTKYIVQSPSMALALRNYLEDDTNIQVFPFSSTGSRETPNIAHTSPKFDFLYIANGEPHKNHRVLLEAWKILAEANLKPSLALTVPFLSNPTLYNQINEIVRGSSLNISNLGHLKHEDVIEALKNSSALIYPSKIESLGLPLIEAAELGVPILASELDYVRDVVVPVETFNPDSPLSIARAVRRFLGQPESPVKINSVTSFLNEVLKCRC